MAKKLEEELPPGVIRCKGVNGTVTFDGTWVTIDRTKGFFTRRGENRIAFSEITSMTWSKPSAMVEAYRHSAKVPGYVYFGVNETRPGFRSETFDPSIDENAVLFTESQDEEFSVLYAAINDKFTELRKVKEASPVPIPVLEVGTNQLQSWSLRCETTAPREFRLTCEAPDGRRWISEARNVFDCLLRLRFQVEKAGLLICCNGARRDAWAYGMAGDMGRGWQVYLLEGFPKEGVRAPLVATLDAASPEQVVTVKEQFGWFDAWRTAFGLLEAEVAETHYEDWLSGLTEQ
jgi:hypothetical protein